MKKLLGVICVMFLVLALAVPLSCTKKEEKETTKEEKTSEKEDGESETESMEEESETEFEVTSSAFGNDEDIPAKYARSDVSGGENISIPLEWENTPDGTKSFAISMVDTHESADNFLHWLVINIDLDITSIEEGASGANMPSFATEFNNDYGEEGYGGPNPPPDSGEHDYEITVYALSIPSMGMTENSGLDEFKSFTEGKVLGEAVISGEFSQ